MAFKVQDIEPQFSFAIPDSRFLIPVDYTRLSLPHIMLKQERVARDAAATFGSLDARQLNWKPDAARWSVGQCLDHLLIANRLMLRQAAEAFDDTIGLSLWQRAPILPRLFGRLLIRSQAPGSTRKFVAAPVAQPAASDIPADVIDRFVAQHHRAAADLTVHDEQAARAIMVLPFVRITSYSGLDGWRLIVAHDHRHLEQARRVTHSPGFPNVINIPSHYQETDVTVLHALIQSHPLGTGRCRETVPWSSTTFRF